jgi:hypothetical protein
MIASIAAKSSSTLSRISIMIAGYLTNVEVDKHFSDAAMPQW